MIHYFSEKKDLDDFRRYLCSDLGGGLTDDVALKHSQQFTYLTSSVGLKIDNKDFSKTLNTFLDSKLKSKTWLPNTIKTYLNSLLKFSNFLIQQKHFGKNQNIEISHVNILKEFILQWQRSLHKKNKEFSKTKAKDYLANSDKISPEDLEKYTKSERASCAKKLLASGSVEGYNLTMHMKVRNFLIMTLTISNAHRSGCITNMLIHEFKAAKSFVRGGFHVIFVANHKTRTTYGPADVVVSPQVYEWMETYLNRFRPASEWDNLFVNWGMPCL